MLELKILRGPPGSGKSTLAKQMQAAFQFASTHGWEDTQWAHYEADMWQTDDGEYNWKPERVAYAHAMCQQYTRNALEGGRSVIVSNTFSRIKEMQPYLDMAKEFGARVTVIHVEGLHGNIHNVPEEVVNNMARRWEKYVIYYTGPDSLHPEVSR